MINLKSIIFLFMNVLIGWHSSLFAAETPSTSIESVDAPYLSDNIDSPSYVLSQLQPGLQPSLPRIDPALSSIFNRFPLRGNSVFDTEFNLKTSNPDPVNSYLATYLATVIYPEFLDQLTGSKLVQDEHYTRTLHSHPISFYSEFKKHTAYLFTNPSYVWIYADQGGYDPEAMVISTSNAVFVVFRGTDRIGASKTNTGYKWAEWLFTDFYAVHDTPDLPTLAGKVHKGFWDSLKAIPKVVRQDSDEPELGTCLNSSRKETSFRECLVSEIRSAAGPSKGVYLIGHSLGAAHAQVFAGYLAGHVNAELESDAIKPKGVYGIAAPHVGNEAFRDKLHTLIGKKRLQRFDFVNDPITSFPFDQFGLYQYSRAGTRIYYDDIQTIQIGAPERFPLSHFGFFIVPALLSDLCFHYPQWYLNAAWSQVPQSIKPNLPIPLPHPRTGGQDPRIYAGCINPITVARGERSEAGRLEDAAAAAAEAVEENLEEIAANLEQVVYDISQLFTNLLTNPVEDGSYYLRLLKGRKYLDISSDCIGENGCDVRLWDIGRSTWNNRFFIKKEFGGYSIRNGSNNNRTFLEIDGGELLRERGRIQMWKANLPPFDSNASNQLWHFYAVPNRPGLFVIRNVLTGKVLSAKNNCVTQNGCKIWQKNANNNDPTQVWILERAQ